MEQLVGDVENLLGDHDIGNALINKLEVAIVKADTNPNAAANTMGAFINQVEAQTGKRLSEEEAAALIEAAQAVIHSLETTTEQARRHGAGDFVGHRSSRAA